MRPLGNIVGGAVGEEQLARLAQEISSTTYQEQWSLMIAGTPACWFAFIPGKILLSQGLEQQNKSISMAMTLHKSSFHNMLENLLQPQEHTAILQLCPGLATPRMSRIQGRCQMWPVEPHLPAPSASLGSWTNSHMVHAGPPAHGTHSGTHTACSTYLGSVWAAPYRPNAAPPPAGLEPTLQRPMQCLPWTCWSGHGMWLMLQNGQSKHCEQRSPGLARAGSIGNGYSMWDSGSMGPIQPKHHSSSHSPVLHPVGQMSSTSLGRTISTQQQMMQIGIKAELHEKEERSALY